MTKRIFHVMKLETFAERKKIDENGIAWLEDEARVV
jgi:hypothetical protein